MTEPPRIYKAIADMQSDVEAIEKLKKVTQGGNYNYRGVDDVFNGIHPLLAKHRVFLVPEVLDETREERTTRSGGTLIFARLKVKFMLFADDGSSVTATVLGEAMDSSDKASTKAQSVAYRIVLLQMLSVPTEETADPETDYHELTAKGEQELFRTVMEKIRNAKTEQELKTIRATYKVRIREGRLAEGRTEEIEEALANRAAELNQGA